MSFRFLIIALTVALSLASIGGIAGFFLQFYKDDKIGALLESELSNTRRMASHLENLVELSAIVDPVKAIDSSDFILLVDEPCSAGQTRRTVVSRHFDPMLRQVGADPGYWSNSFDVFKACRELAEAPAGSSQQGLVVRFLPASAQIMVPYVLALTQRSSPGGVSRRLAMIALDGFRSATHNTAFLTRSDGVIVWAGDGKEFLDGALADTGVEKDVLVRKAVEASQGAGPGEEPKVEPVGREGLLSQATVGGGWALMSLSYAPALMDSVWFAVSQLTLLAVGILFLCLLLGKILGERLLSPIHELMAYADRIGTGDLSTTIDEGGLVEFARVKAAFNTMSRRIRELIEATRGKAEMEKEILLAQQVQKMLIPPPYSEFVDHRVSGTMKPANFVGGDWWGVAEVTRKERSPLLILCVGDATSHGVPPALVAATVKGAYSVLMEMVTDKLGAHPDAPIDPLSLLAPMHRTIFDSAKGTISMTMVLALLDPVSKKSVIVNAGHVRPYLVTSAGAKMVGGAGMGLGIGPQELSIEVEEHPWNCGDRLIFYSDGLVENFKGDENVFGRKELSRALRGMLQLGARELMNRILQLWAKLAKGVPQEDDVTLVVCEFKQQEVAPDAT